ncbi:MAG TPA: succinate dehydrogenase/fumarate reductase iron-sulfur subunit [Planctomycetes bacterium]|nr:succinate dehydrogenase/fumarate reductase iron-sulfur subunit [Planctomycetota bacterium]
MRITVHVWRQAGPQEPGKMVAYDLDNVNEHMSFLEMLDFLNESLIAKGEEPIAFDSDCREGICGMCSLVIDGIPHGPEKETTVCQLHMRHFHDGQEIFIEPWRAKSFPVLKDLIIDRSSLDRIQQAGGFISVNTGSAPDANNIPIGKEQADRAMDAAACIGCGACVAACKNASAMLFVGAKVSHLALLPQGQVEKKRRAIAMVEAMDAEGFGNCTNQYECEAACPKGISVEFIAKMNREYLGAQLSGRSS